jgi:hypothetical protein
MLRTKDLATKRNRGKIHIDMRKISRFARTTICATFVEQQSGLRQVAKDCDATRKM